MTKGITIEDVKTAIAKDYENRANEQALLEEIKQLERQLERKKEEFKRIDTFGYLTEFGKVTGELHKQLCKEMGINND